jgi:deoxyribonuclease V
MAAESSAASGAKAARGAANPAPGVDPASYGRRTPREALALQRELERDLDLADAIGPPDRTPRVLAGIDVSEKHGRARAAVVLLGHPTFELLECARAELPLEFPYVPGLLAFREVPVIAAAWSKLERRADLAFVDGHGRAHPRRFGLACHLGSLLGVPTVGVGKSLLVGERGAVCALGTARGARRPLVDRGETIGTVLRTRAGVAPVFVSVGARIGLANAVRWVLACAKRYRLPEPIRAAHRAASLARGELEAARGGMEAISHSARRTGLHVPPRLD